MFTTTQRSSFNRIAEINGHLSETEKFNIVRGPAKSESSRKNAVNSFLSKLGHEYHQHIPLDAIFKNLDQNGWKVVQEDGEAWSGFLTGKQGRANFDLVDIATGKPSKKFLHMSWYKMDVSGKYEVTAYVN